MPSYYRNTSLRILGISGFTTCLGNAGLRPLAESLKGKMMKLGQTLPRTSPESGRTAIPPGHPQPHPSPQRPRDQEKVRSVDVEVIEN